MRGAAMLSFSGEWPHEKQTFSDTPTVRHSVIFDGSQSGCGR
jgi:hypothetical protein